MGKRKVREWEGGGEWVTGRSIQSFEGMGGGWRVGKRKVLYMGGGWSVGKKKDYTEFEGMGGEESG